MRIPSFFLRHYMSFFWVYVVNFELQRYKNGFRESAASSKNSMSSRSTISFDIHVSIFCGKSYRHSITKKCTELEIDLYAH